MMIEESTTTSTSDPVDSEKASQPNPAKPLSLAELSQRTQRFARAALIFYGLFLGILLINFNQLFRPQAPAHWLVALMQLVPLLGFAPAFIYQWRKGLLGCSFVVLLYLCFTVINLSREVALPVLIYVELMIELGLIGAICGYGFYYNKHKKRVLGLE